MLRSGKVWIGVMLCLLVLFLFPQTAKADWEIKDGVCYNDKGEVIEGALKMGVDVSSWDGTVDWNKLKRAGVEFAFVRVGHGDEPLDKQFHRNMQEANKAGIPAGVYFYSMATTAERSVLDAEFLLNQIQGYQIGYPIVVDMESENQEGLTTQQRTEIARVFCEKVSEAGYYPMIYCNEWWYQSMLDMSELEQYHMWVARYASTYNPNIPREIWQATNTGHVDGINGECDIDFSFVDYTQVITPRTQANSGVINGIKFNTPDPSPSWYQTQGIWKYYCGGGVWAADGWKKISGKWYAFDSQGNMLTGWYKDGNTWYYLGSSGAMATGWLKLGSTTYYLNGSGAMVTGWQKIGGKQYYFQSSGAMASGLQSIDGKWYKFDASGVSGIPKGWNSSQGKWYYFDNNGIMKTGWQKVSGKWYYLDGSGVMKTGWQKVSGKWYYLDGSGAMKTGWQKVSGRWYYLNKSGAMLTGWQKVSGKWYYLEDSGAMKTGWQKVSGKWYYLDGSGVMKTGWQKAGGKWYYLNGSGVMLTGWQRLGGKWYYLDGNGIMKTGWQKVSGRWYYLNGSGVMLTGWQKVGQSWYYLEGSGVMKTGWLKLGSKWYYLKESGAMASGCSMEIGEKTYRFAASGVWIP